MDSIVLARPQRLVLTPTPSSWLLRMDSTNSLEETPTRTKITAEVVEGKVQEVGETKATMVGNCLQ